MVWLSRLSPCMLRRSFQLPPPVCVGICEDRSHPFPLKYGSNSFQAKQNCQRGEKSVKESCKCVKHLISTASQLHISSRILSATYRSLPAIVRSGIVEYPSNPTTAGLQPFELANFLGLRRTGNILRKATCEKHADHSPSCVNAENK